ncbi:MAG TPA: heterodisulfide reductase-related iron-sulfur binding cluster [Candidatus Binataceae bacterium]|jgi:glycolate oxidase iron-sulfur subunit|nr:heterodisulfide reductase-related iron-sulfur binding cluster [Candidatus Binataceae bacterium]
MADASSSAAARALADEQPVKPGAPAVRAAPARDVVDYDLLFDCVHCGLCLESCPTYLVTRAEMDSPRGRVYLMKALAEGRIALDRDVVRHFDACLGCRGCETACPSGVHYGRLLERARDYVGRNYQRALGDGFRRAAMRAIFPFPARLRALLWPLRVAERMGLRDVVRRLAPRGLREWIDLVPPRQFGAPLYPQAPAAAKPDAPSAVVHQGCVAQVLTPSENLNSERALAAAGYRVVRLGHTVCCGALDLHDGNLRRGLEFARRNVRALRASGAEAIVCAASGCAAAIASYGELLKDDPELAADARAVSARTSDLGTLLLARGGAVGKLECVVTYHDSCHLVHGMGVREAPRKLLRSVPGVRVVEMAESDLCCGSAGSYNLLEPAMAHELARRKADNIEATGADFVVLGNPGCEFQIAAELRRRGSRVRVIHLADFLALAAAGP